MKIALLGYGKMGKTIEKIALSKGYEVILCITEKNADGLTRKSLQQADVAIEFSRPETAFNNIVSCLEAGVPVVSGTTGWLGQMDAAKELCARQKGTFFYASNFSIGVNVFFALNKYLAHLMKDRSHYDVSMEEVHHLEKLDYPSGTAITLAEGILANIQNKNKWEAVLGKPDEEGKDNTSKDSSSLLITSKRIEAVPGTHIIKWSSGIDELVISHAAHSREGFAAGALAAAEWVIGKEGFFGMEDMLGF